MKFTTSLTYNSNISGKSTYEELKADIDKRVKKLEVKYGEKMREKNVSTYK